METYDISFIGYCAIDAETRREAWDKFYELTSNIRTDCECIEK